MEKQRWTVSRAQQKECVDDRHVNAFVEQVHGKEHINAPRRKIFERTLAWMNTTKGPFPMPSNLRFQFTTPLITMALVVIGCFVVGLHKHEVDADIGLTPPSGATTLAPLVLAMNYLLLGALFLGIGSQASSVREVQTISMPITIGQILIFLGATFASRFIDSPFGIAAAIFPFSSPMMMIARAAESGGLWPHLAALLWQGLWVWLIIRLGAAFLRTNVMKSGGGPAAAFGWRRRA